MKREDTQEARPIEVKVIQEGQSLIIRPTKRPLPRFLLRSAPIPIPGPALYLDMPITGPGNLELSIGESPYDNRYTISIGDNTYTLFKTPSEGNTLPKREPKP